LIGRYIGDGSITYRGDTPSIFQIVFNANNERHAYDKIKSIIEEKFGVVVTDNSNYNQNTLVLKGNNILFGQFMLQMAGRIKEKHLPSRYYGDIDVLLGLLDSDGTVSNGAIKLTMKNESIIEDVREWLSVNNIISHIKKIFQTSGTSASEIRISKSQSSKILSMMTKKYKDSRMSLSDTACSSYKVSRERYVGPVYNLSVENNHNYVVNGVLVHNCYVITPPEDNLESIYNTDYRLARTYSYGG